MTDLLPAAQELLLANIGALDDLDADGQPLTVQPSSGVSTATTATAAASKGVHFDDVTAAPADETAAMSLPAASAQSQSVALTLSRDSEEEEPESEA